MARHLLSRLPGQARVSGIERERQRKAQGTAEANGVGNAFDTKGFAHVGHLGSLLADLKKLGAQTKGLERSAEAVLRMWERAHDDERKPLKGDVDLSGIVPHRGPEDMGTEPGVGTKLANSAAAVGAEAAAKVKQAACRIKCCARHPLQCGPSGGTYAACVKSCMR